MPIVIRNNIEMTMVDYSDERSLVDLLIRSPRLIAPDDGSDIAYVGREIILREAGKLDLLFINAEGLPIAVEVKLRKNSESRREVVAQALDYMSSLATMTIEEINSVSGGGLERAIKSIADDIEPEALSFDQLWDSFALNLRAGRSRMMVVLDAVQDGGLERIFRFLAEKSRLDVQLVTVQKFGSGDPSTVEEIYVPRSLVDVPTNQRSGIPSETAKIDWDAVIEGTSNQAMADFLSLCLKENQKFNENTKRLVFPSQGVKWRLEPRKDFAWVMQGRFNGDEDYWKSRLSDPKTVTIHRDEKRLHFILKTKEDFQVFLNAVQNDLKDTMMQN